MLAFAQAVNLNSDAHLQHCITKCLTSILETHLSQRLKLETENTQVQSLHVTSPVIQTAGAAKNTNLHFSDEEKRAVQTLVRTYLSNFSLSLNHSSAGTDNKSKDQETGSSNDVTETHDLNKDDCKIASDKNAIVCADDADKNICFGSIPSFVSYLLSLNTPGGNISPQSQNIKTSPLLPSEDSRENFTKLIVITLLYIFCNHIIDY